jgi:hypothetical protein
MRRSLAACLVLACSMPVFGQQSLDAQVEQTAPNAFRIRVTFPGAVTPGQAQAALAEVGKYLCKGEPPAWGHYTFETIEPQAPAKDMQASTKFEQELTCGPAVARSGTPAPKTPATDTDRRDVETRTLDYLARKDRGDFVGADAMFLDEVLASLRDRAEARGQRGAFNAEVGAPAKRRILDVTFYDDPADAPRLGRYAAVDYRAAYDSRAFYCGYVMWLRQADGSWRLVREVETIVTDKTARSAPAETLAKIQQQPGCREPVAAE